MAFPQTPLDLRAEIYVGGAWTDISPGNKAYQRQGTSPPAVITRGRPDESSSVNASSAVFQANNRNGNLSPRNPLGTWYGQLGRNTPLRLSVPAQTSYMRIETDTASYAQCPDATGLHVTGDIDIRIDLKPSDYQFAALAGKNSGGTGPSWLLERNGSGTLAFFWWDSGSVQHSVASTLPIPAGRLALRVTMAAATGTVTFYTAPNISGSWTQLGAAASGSSGAATSVFGGTAVLRVGDNSSASYGSYYGFQLRNGIGGTVVASPDFTAQSAGAASFTDAQGNTFTLNGTAEISDRNYRYHGELSSLPPKWDTTGTDVYVPVTAGGLLRRVGQGSAPVQSPMKRAVLSQSGSLAPAAYWPCEDAAGAAALGSATGGTLMSFDASPAPKLASDSSFACSSALLMLNGTRMHGTVPAYAGGSALTCRFLCKLGTLPASNAVLMRLITTGTCREFTLRAYSGGALGISGWAADGTNVFDTGAVSFGAGGAAFWYSLEATPISGGQSYAVVTLAPGASTGQSASITPAMPASGTPLTNTVTSVNATVVITGGSVSNVVVNGVSVGTGPGTYTVPAGQAITLTYSSAPSWTWGIQGGVHGNVTDVWVNPAAFYTDTVFGQCQVQSAWVSLFSLFQPLNAWQGETAGARFLRLAAENGYAARITGPPSATAAMGAQPVAAFASLLTECEDADRGLVYEPRQVLALGYRTLASMLNQSPAVTLDYSLAQAGGTSTGGALEPTYDDQYTRNDVTVTRSAGSVTGATYQYALDDGSAMSVSAPPAGVGDYSTSLSVNVQADTQLPNIAGWAVHVGTVNEARWPVIPLNLARPALSSLYYTLLDLDIGDYAELVNLLTAVTYDPVRQLAFQVTERLGGFFHELDLTCVPESPYEVIVLDDAVYGRVDTDGSVLHANATSGATSVTVDTTSGFPLWTTAAADFPFDINIGGERMTVTNITGSSSPQTFTVTRSVNGVVKAQSAGADVRLWFPPVLSLA